MRPRQRDNRIRFAAGRDGIERLEAHLYGQAFSLHRHDTYAIGITLSGVQSFRFRGAQWHCLPGQVHILHPDELHDGGAGTEAGFRYRIAYIDPALVQKALGGQPLPFVANPVIDLAQLADSSGLWDFDATIDDLTQTELAATLADALTAATSSRSRPFRPLALEAVKRVRDVIAARPVVSYTMNDLERVAGLDRWTLARQFRAAFGTSPSRFRIQRQLDIARRLLKSGKSAAAAAHEAGFADQSHMSRQFRRAYGLTPAQWAWALV